MTTHNCIDHMRLGPRPETPQEREAITDRIEAEIRDKLERRKNTEMQDESI